MHIFKPEILSDFLKLNKHFYHAQNSFFADEFIRFLKLTRPKERPLMFVERQELLLTHLNEEQTNGVAVHVVNHHLLNHTIK